MSQLVAAILGGGGIDPHSVDRMDQAGRVVEGSLLVSLFSVSICALELNDGHKSLDNKYFITLEN